MFQEVMNNPEITADITQLLSDCCSDLLVSLRILLNNWIMEDILLTSFFYNMEYHSIANMLNVETSFFLLNVFLRIFL